VLIGVLALVGAFVWLPSSAAAQNGPPPAQVRVEPLEMMDVERRRSVTGDLRASARSRVATQQAGQVLEMLVDVGDEVDRGAVIARLDKELLQIDLDRAESEVRANDATISERRASIRLAQFNVDRLEILAQSQGATPRELQDARVRLDEAQARLAIAEADLAAAEADAASIRKRISDTEVRAPFAGQIIRKATEVGEWLPEGGEVVEMVSIETIDAYLDVPQQFVAALQRVGLSDGERATVSIKIDALGLVVESSDVVVIGDGDRLARSFPVRVRIVNPDRDMKPGMSVTGSVPTGERTTVLTMSKDAVLRNDAGTIAYYNENGAAAVRPVELLFAVGDRYVIREQRGWSEGDMVVVEGNERLFPSQPLNILNGSAESGDASAGERPAEARGG
jgi:RND family efflux transporter MFP subunit